MATKRKHIEISFTAGEHRRNVCEAECTQENPTDRYVRHARCSAGGAGCTWTACWRRSWTATRRCRTGRPCPLLTEACRWERRGLVARNSSTKHDCFHYHPMADALTACAHWHRTLMTLAVQQPVLHAVSHSTVAACVSLLHLVLGRWMPRLGKQLLSVWHACAVQHLRAGRAVLTLRRRPGALLRRQRRAAG